MSGVRLGWVFACLVVALAPAGAARATPESLGAVHLGLSGGYGWLSDDLDLSGRRQLPASPSAAPCFALDLGVGLGRHASVELSGWALPSRVQRGAGDAVVMAGLAELSLHALSGPVSLSWSLGAGALSVVAGDLGRDADLLASAGMGARWLLANRRIALRADLRVWLSDGADRALSVSPVLSVGVDVYLRRSTSGAEAPAPRPRDAQASIPRGTPACSRPGAAAGDRGCRDSDGDGVLDFEDLCDEHPGSAAMEGCPDTDGDGVPDPRDECPTLAGEPALAGCSDRDADGVADREDACPDARGPAERGGCPEPPADALAKLQGPLAGVRFARRSARLLPGSDASLEAVVSILAAWPDLRVVVEAHAARGGSRERALALTRRQADAVVAELIALGADPRRLRSVGRGYDAPVASNATAAGRARNERVELHLDGP
ncbi:MAG: OmpA family protein [Deltaproteobacteria bacterium]|nr:OmpA family protein [Deltaproteobacteria bacterium]MCB9788701.1 OmpA family protein [Deltaproteobacteria bacterium]